MKGTREPSSTFIHGSVGQTTVMRMSTAQAFQHICHALSRAIRPTASLMQAALAKGVGSDARKERVANSGQKTSDYEGVYPTMREQDYREKPASQRLTAFRVALLWLAEIGRGPVRFWHPAEKGRHQLAKQTQNRVWRYEDFRLYEPTRRHMPSWQSRAKIVHSFAEDCSQRSPDGDVELG